MRLIDGRIKFMREELAKLGIISNTNEIRESYGMSGLVSIITYMPAREVQDTHKHLLTKEAIQILAGEAEVYADGEWQLIKQRQLAEFDLGEYHSVRALERRKPVIYPDADDRIAAVTMAYRWVPGWLNVNREETSIILKYDRFTEKYESNPNDPSTNLLSRADEKIRKQFWEVVERNQQEG